MENQTDKKSNPQTIQFPNGTNIKPKLKTLCELIQKRQVEQGGLHIAKVPMYAAAIAAVDHMIRDLESEQNSTDLVSRD
tara:strand:+ start:2172 stop:2408 length:237 start_codon:yes stop_codon:yes gene_type:complete